MRQGIKEKDIRDFEKYAQKLDDIMKRIQEYHPTANYYLNMDNLHLMSDVPFNENYRYNEKFEVSSVWIRSSSGGEK